MTDYETTGLRVAIDLVNELTPGFARGRPVDATEPLPALIRILAVDPTSVTRLDERDGPGFVALADHLRQVFAALDTGDVDAGAHRLNDLLTAHPANPHLAEEDGRWRLHHHPTATDLVPMWTSICAEGTARVLGDGDAGRLGTCAATDCDRVFVDTSKNGSRRFCSTTCQNRTKTAAFRARRSRP